MHIIGVTRSRGLARNPTAIATTPGSCDDGGGLRDGAGGFCQGDAMAIVHRAELTPSKMELLQDWLPHRDWFVDGGPVERVATYRFDDPEGGVGIETYIVRSGDRMFHVPLTYRGGPLDGADLVGRMEHSVLGQRWVYDAASDPVYRAVVTDAIVSAGHEVASFFDDGTPAPVAPWAASVAGTGADAGSGELVVARELPASAPTDAPRLTATWDGQAEPVALAWLVG